MAGVTQTLGWVSTVGSALALASGCTPQASDQSTTTLVLDEGESGDEGLTGDGDGDGDDDPNGDGDGEGFGDGCSDELDILLVIDNSGSMAVVQYWLVQALPGLVAALDGAGLDWRIGVTTSDNGNPLCPPSQTIPESGKLVLSSCRSRLGEFVLGDELDVRDYLCNDLCPSSNFTITPTVTEADAQPSPRPWIERIDGQTNVSGLDLVDALRCVIPMGVDGCWFESQLESTYLALARAWSPGEASYGFLRSDASLLVLIVTDAADCSYNKSWSAIFSAEGNKVFWSDPSAPSPTSAVCWNAGVECVGDPNNYDSCDPQDLDVDGNPTTSPDAAVLQPISRYIEQLDQIREFKQGLDPGARVRLALLGGVGPDGAPHYADVTHTDPQFQDSFGIGPGCQTSNISAVPPVRMREVALASDGSLGSVCGSNYSVYLTGLVESFVKACD